MPLADMNILAGAARVITSAMVFLSACGVVLVGGRPLKQYVLRQEYQFERVLRGSLLLDIRPRVATIVSAAVIVILAIIGYRLTGSILGFVALGGVGVLLPSAMLKLLKKRRIARLEQQLVGGIQTLASGVRAGLNLVQAMGLVARDGPVPLRQEFAHLLREYEFGLPLEEAMDNAAARIGSTDFRLLFSALKTHRERGGDLGLTLDRISASIREIQRLEGRIKTLTAQGKASAKFLAMLVVLVLAALYLIAPEAVRNLFVDDLGKVLLFAIVVLNVVGFLWIRKIVDIDI